MEVKQGRANTKNVQHSEYNIPRSNAVDPGRVDQIGQAVHFIKTDLYKGRGYEAPMKGTEVHHCGSQGKH
jgi:hypothetical protein